MLAYGLTVATTQALTEKLSKKLNLPEDVIAAALQEITREELLKIARNESEKILGEVLPLQQEEEIDLTLYEGKQAC